MRITPRRSVAATAALLALLCTAALGTAATASAEATPQSRAADPSASSTTGWVRVAHLSPDTKSVDVRIAALSGGSTLFELDSVAYGAVSKYVALPAGVYTVGMLPAGSNPALKPMISASVQVTVGKASTVAAYGLHKQVKVKIFTDDLTAPAAGQARIRLIQGSAKVNAVNVSTTTGITVATDARAGTATGYAQIAAGPWMLQLKAANLDQQAEVSLGDRTVTTILVLDSTGGRLALQPILDSAAVGAAPVGGVQTGGGYLAAHPTRPTQLVHPASYLLAGLQRVK